MPKGRHLKPEFFTDKHIVSVSPLARLLYQGLWCYAADCGHLEDEPIEFKMRILPADSCDVDELLEELAKAGRITRSEGWIGVPTLAQHARIDKRYETLCDSCKEPGEVNAALLGNHIRWHQKRGVTAPDCEFCTSDTGGTPIVSTTGTDPEPDTNPTAPHRNHVADGDGDGDGDGDVAITRKRAHQLPNDFAPNDTNRRIATERGVDLDHALAQFADHHRAKGSTMKDWHLAFNTWLRREKPSQARRPAPRYLQPHEVELPPDGLTPEEYAAWERGQREKRRGA